MTAAARTDIVRIVFALIVVATCYFTFLAVARGHVLGLDSDTAKLALWIPIPLFAALLAGGFSDFPKQLGLAQVKAQHLAPGIVAGLVMTSVLGLYYGRAFGTPAPDAILFKSITGPVTEELVFRGFLVSQLLLAGFARPGAILLSAAIFGALHIPNPAVWGSGDPATIAGVFAISAAGGALFAAVMTMAGGSVIAAMALHAGLNFVWELFAVGPTAIGDGEANVARLAAVAAGLLTAVLVGRLRP